MKSIFRILFSAFAIFFISCTQNESPSKTNNLFKFKEYISYHTYGTVSIAEPIKIELSKFQQQYELTQEIPSKFIIISPKTEGKLLIENGRTLVFKPSEYLKPNTAYTVTLKLDSFYEDIQKDFKKFTFSFKTIAPNFKINLNQLQSYSKNWQFITGTLETADLISFENAKKLIEAKQGDKTLKLKWNQEQGHASYFNFTIDSISRKQEDSKIKIYWDGKHIETNTKGENTFEIPGLNNFKVIDVKSTLAPSASLSVNFSDPLKENQNFNGLVDIEKAVNLRFEVDGNVLHIYPSNRIIGKLRVTIFDGIRNTENLKLKKEFSELVSFEQLKPAIKLLSSGMILPQASSTPFYFETVNLSAVDVRIIKIYKDNMLQFLQDNNLNEAYSYNIKRVGRRIAKKTIHFTESSSSWQAHALNLSELFNADAGALYRIEISFKKEYSTYDCSSIVSENNEEDQEEEYYYDDDISSTDDEEEREERYWDNELYRWRHYSYNWRERENPCHQAYYHEDQIAMANILGSDLGFIVKKGNNQSYHLAVNNLLTTQPEENASIKLYNFQQQLIGSTTTDKEGLAIFDSEKTISFAVAQKNNQYAYLKLEDGNALSLSKFDVSGKQLQKGIKGFIYTERGVYRPGDHIHLTFVLNDNTNPLPKNHPVKLELLDARGKLVKRTVLNQDVEGFYYFPITTDTNAPTGNWLAKISVGGAKFSKTIKVATIKPNRLKLNLTFEDEILDANKPINGNLKALWLHGAPARNLKAEMDITLRTTNTAFKKYPNYNFNDPIRTFEKVEQSILKNKLSSEGVFNFSKKIDLSGKAPGMLKATFLTKVFEGGGDFSMDVFSKNLAPYSYFVGLQSPKAHRYGSYFTDENTTFDVVSVDAQGKSSGNRKLNIKVFKIEWRWWWNRGQDNLSRYENTTVHRPVKDFSITTGNNGKGNFIINIPEEDGGRYLIRVIDEVSGHATGRICYFYRNWWKSPTQGDSESAKMLVFSANKEKYKVGEEAIITFPSASQGRALISVENGTEVLSKQWVDTKKGETTVFIPLTKEMTPNVYIHISLLQAHEQTKNDLPMRLYGVIPVLVEDPTTILQPSLKMPKVLKPEEKFTLQVSEEKNKEMTYTIALVDEGLLDLTRFETPKIHEAFYTREALGVKTFDMYDDVIGAYSGSVDNIYAIGGGDQAAGAKSRKADRFKPVITFLGPFTLAKGEKASHEINMPNYIGSVRTMVIAGDKTKNAYGKTDQTTPVRKPLMVLASLPRKLSPGEQVTLPVTVFAMEKNIKDVKVEVKTGSSLKPINGLSKNIHFSEIGEKIVNFEFEVFPTNQFQKIEVVVSGQGEKASNQVEIDVENPNPINQKVTSYVLSNNETKELSFQPFGIAGTNGVSLEFSTLPAMNFGKRMEYLIQYPHGCVEQTTSSVFPQLFLATIFDITFDKKKEIEKNIKAGIKRLSHFQTSNGGMAYWQGESQADEWGSNYAGHFMLEAKAKGYALPITFLDNWLQYQKNKARKWRNNNTPYNASLIQAYRLYTLALAGQPELAAMNRLRASKNLSNDAKWRLAAAYALVGKKEVAQKIAQTANINFVAQDYDYYTYGSPFRNKAMALETLVSLGDPTQRELAISIAKSLSSQQWYSTQETAYALLAMAKMVSKNGGKSLEVSYTQNQKQNLIKTDRAIAQRDIPFVMGENSISLTNLKNNTVFMSVIQKGKLPLGEEISEQKKIQVKTVFYDGEQQILDPSNLKQGTEIEAKVTVYNPTNDWLGNIALTQIFPSGWEIVNTSFTDLQRGTKGDARYTDIRDDRVHFYFDIGARKSKTFSMKLNASYLGKYYLPGTQVEAMYDANYYARTKGQWVKVVQ